MSGKITIVGFGTAEKLQHSVLNAFLLNNLSKLSAAEEMRSSQWQWGNCTSAKLIHAHMW